MSKPHQKTNRSEHPIRFSRYLIILFVLALTVRLLHVWQISAHPFLSLLLGDAQSYDTWAKEIASGNWLGSKVFYQAPLYPYFLGIIYTVFSSNVLVVRILQAFIGACSCVMLAAAGRRFFSKQAGITTGLILALYAPAIFFDELIGKSVLDLFFICFATWFLGKLTAKPDKLLCLVVGMAMGGLSLTRENALLLIAAIFIWLLFYRGFGKQRPALIAMFFSGLAVVLLPVVIRNYVVGGQFYLTTSQFGPNFYIGNNEHSNGTYKPLRYGRGHPEHESSDATELAELATGKKLTPSGVSGYWLGRSFDYITSQPADWLVLKVKTFLMALNDAEIADTEDEYTYSDCSVPLRLAGYVFKFGIIAPIALLGIIVTWNKREKLWLLHLMLAVYTISMVMFFVLARIRYPMIPFLILFAAAGLTGMRNFLRTSSPGKIAVSITATIAFAIFCNWPITSKDTMRATTHVNVGYVLFSQDRLEEAISHYSKALKLSPDYAEAHNNIANAYQALGKPDKAVSHLRQALQYAPYSVDILNNLGSALRSQGSFNEAISYYQKALQIRPNYTKADTYNNLGITFEKQGKFDNAMNCYRQSLQIDPNHANAYYNLGNISKTQGKFDEAISYYQQALRILPDYAEAYNNLGVVLKTQGKVDEAIGYFQKALRINPDTIEAHYNMANAFKLQGKLDEAVFHYQQILRLEPNSAEVHYKLGVTLTLMGSHDKALEHIRQANRLAPNRPEPLASMARILATHPVPEQRDSKKAVIFAKEAAKLTNYQDATILDTLATAYAAAGQFDLAISTAKTALDLASKSQNEALSDHLLKQIELYKQAKK